MLLTFTEDAWTDYCYWQKDRKSTRLNSSHVA